MSTDALAEELKLEARREELLRRLGQPIRTKGS
jgi:hypothetical protein